MNHSFFRRMTPENTTTQIRLVPWISSELTWIQDAIPLLELVVKAKHLLRSDRRDAVYVLRSMVR
jgi:hypothetical protein